MSQVACIRACTVKGRHVDCDDPDDCTGCELRAAKYGLLCKPCHLRLELMLHDAATVDDWLTVNMGALGSVAAKEDFERAKGGDDGSPAPISVGIFDVRQLMRDRFTLWVDDLCSVIVDMNGKALDGPERHDVRTDAAFLRHWLDSWERKDWIEDAWNELAECMTDAHALAPWRPAMTRRSGIPCPECEATMLVTFGGEECVTCLSCKSIMSQNGYAMWLQVLRERARPQEQTA